MSLKSASYHYGRMFGQGSHSGYITKRRSVAAAGLAGRRMGALMKARSARNIPNLEFKARDTDQAATAVNSTGSVVLLNGLGRGDDMHERIARRATIRSCEWKIQTYGTDTTGVQQVHRHLLVWDKNPNATTPAITDILMAATVNAPRNLSNRTRFIILYDRRVMLNSSAIGGDFVEKVVQGYKQVYLQSVFNGGDAGTVADIQNGALFWVAIGSVAAGVTAGSYKGYFRVRFTDP